MSENVLVIGASGAVGGDLCRRLHARGARLFLAGRDEGKLQSLAEELSMPWKAIDATDHEAVAALSAEATQAAPLTGAVNLAGSILLKSAHGTSPEEWHATLATNLTTAFYLLKHTAPAMREGGSIVLLSSAAASIGMANHEAIAAAKAGVEGLVRSAAATYATRNVRVNAVAPGLVDTPLAAKVTGNEAALKASIALHPLRRIGTAAQVASAIAWLLDPEQSWVTGQVLGVDGGLSRVKTLGTTLSRS